MKAGAKEPASLLHDFIAQQHANVFMRAFSFAARQLPMTSDKEVEVADRVLLMDDIGFIFQLREREQKVASKPGDLERWVTNHVSRKGAKQIQNTRELLASYVGLSLVNHFGHRMTISRKDPDAFVSVIIYRVPEKTRAFRAARFKRSALGSFVHILRDVDYFEICQHFVTPAELVDYFNFRRDILLGWDPPSTAVSESALIGQYLLEDYSSPPDQRFERSARQLWNGSASASIRAISWSSLTRSLWSWPCWDATTCERSSSKSVSRSRRYGETGSSCHIDSPRDARSAAFSSSL